MSPNKLLTEGVSRDGAIARHLRVIYLPAEYDENRKSPVSISDCAPDHPKKGGDTRNPDRKHVCFCGLEARSDFSRDAERR